MEGKQYIAAQKSRVQHTFYDTAGFHDHMVYENLVMTLHPYNLRMEVQATLQLTISV